jgi:Na+/glutamate symporter
MDTVFLVVSLFLPRTILIIYYFIHQIPLNTVPFIGDVLLTIFIPRALILIYVAQVLGTDSPWFWIHLVVGVFVYFGGGRKVKKWKNK